MDAPQTSNTPSESALPAYLQIKNFVLEKSNPANGAKAI